MTVCVCVRRLDKDELRMVALLGWPNGQAEPLAATRRRRQRTPARRTPREPLATAVIAELLLLQSQRRDGHRVAIPIPIPIPVAIAIAVGAALRHGGGA